jgi:surface antigen
MQMKSKWKNWCAFSLLATTAVTSVAHADQQTWGTILGGVIGAVAGNSVGGGNGRIAATILGAGIGAALGNGIGESLDEKDKLEAENAYLRSLNGGINEPYDWQGTHDPDNRGRFQTHTEFRNEYGYNCRTYVSETWIHGQYDRHEGTSCYYPDGSWREWTRETSSSPRPRYERRRYTCVLRDDFGATYVGRAATRVQAEDAAAHQCSQYRNPRFCLDEPRCDLEVTRGDSSDYGETRDEYRRRRY